MAENAPVRKMSREEAAYVERVYQNQYMMVGNAINAALEELQELGTASKTLEEMKGLIGKGSLAAIGGEFYLKSEIKKDSKVLVSIGGGFMLEKDPESAWAIAKKRMDAKNEVLNKLAKSRKEIEDAVIQLQSGADQKGGE